MNKMGKIEVNEIITVGTWMDGDGWYNEKEVLSDQVILMTEKEIEELKKEEYDWSWWEKINCENGDDLKITVEYKVNGETIAEHEAWQSEI